MISPRLWGTIRRVALLELGAGRPIERGDEHEHF